MIFVMKMAQSPPVSLNVTLVLFLLVVSAVPALAQTKTVYSAEPLYGEGSPPENQSPGFFIAPLIEIPGYSRKGPAFGGGLSLGAGDGVTIGCRFLYAIDTESVHTLEIAIFMRFYLNHNNAVTGPFIQFNTGASIHALNSFPSFPAEAGGLSVDLAAGWRFPLGRRWYIEPAIRAGYAFILGAGVAFAYRL
jgi:hypothetical protein